MRRGTRVLCSIFGFYLTLALLVPQLVLAMEGHFLNPNVIRAELCTRQSAGQVLELVLADGSAVANSCGVSPEVCQGVFTEDAILQDLQGAVSGAFAAQAYEPDLRQSLEQLSARVRQELTETEGITDFTDYEPDITAFCTQIGNIYKQYINLSVYSRFPSIQSTGRRMEQLAGLVGGVTGLLTVALLWLTTRRAGLFLREAAFSVTASGGLLSILTGAALIAKPFARVQVWPVYLRDALRNYLHDGIAYGLYVGLGTLAVGLVLFAAAAFLIGRASSRQRHDV